MRVISGSCKGRKLVQIHGQQIRPTSDRVKEAIFNILGQKVKQARVLDLFAGTGALGIEALSRGADHATFIDIDCNTIHKNLALCCFKGNASVISCDIIQGFIPKNIFQQQYDLIFIDPPYNKGYIEHTVEKESFINLLKKDGIIIAEQSCKENLKIKLTSLDIYRQKKYSKTLISFMNKT